MFAVTGGKGGVGKTTTALGLATAAARAGRRPVVVDADRDCPDLAALAGTDGAGIHRLADGDPLAVAGTRVAGATVLGARFDTDERALAAALDRLDGRRRPVFLDCPAGAGRPAAMPLRRASAAVVVTRPTERALVDARKAATMARRLDAPPRGVVVSRADSPGRLPGVFDAPVLGRLPHAGQQPAWDATKAAYDAVYGSLVRQNP